MFSTVMAAYECKYNIIMAANVGNVQLSHGCLCWQVLYSSVMATYTDTAQLLSWLPIWVLEQYCHGYHLGTDTVISWLPVRDR